MRLLILFVHAGEALHLHVFQLGLCCLDDSDILLIMHEPNFQRRPQRKQNPEVTRNYVVTSHGRFPHQQQPRNTC